MSHKHHHGFTLIELVVTVAIVGILAAIAYPSYIEYVQQSRRADCKAVMLTYVNALERRFSTDNAYPDSLDGYSCASSDGSATYDLELDVAADGSSYTLSATPAGSQSQDKCGTLSVTNTGTKDATGTGSCW